MHFKKLPAHNTQANGNIQGVLGPGLGNLDSHVGLTDGGFADPVYFIPEHEAIPAVWGGRK